MSAPAWWHQPPVRMRGVPPPFPVWRPPTAPVYERLPALPWISPGRWVRDPMLAAITFVQVTTQTSSGGTSITKPTGTTDGDLVLIFQGNASAGVPSGFTRIYTDNNPASVCSYRISASDGASYTWTTGSKAICHTYRGVDPGDPIMAVRCSINGLQGDNLAVPDLFFQSCDFMGVIFNRQGANLTPSVPASWTQTGSINGTSGGDYGLGGGRRSFTNTEGMSGQGSFGGNSGGARTMSIALRALGETALSLKSFSPDAGLFNSSGTSSGALAMPQDYHVGDLLVVAGGYKHAIDGNARTWTTPTSYTKFGSDQNNIIDPAPAPFSVIGGVIFYKIATGSNDQPTLTVNTTVSNVGGYVLAFSTGSTGDPPELPPTLGQANDTSNNSTLDYPGMTMNNPGSSYIDIIAGFLDLGNIGFTSVTGFSELADRQQATAGDQNSGIYARMDSGPNPTSASGTLSGSARGVTFQFAVAVTRSRAKKNKQGSLDSSVMHIHNQAVKRAVYW